MADIMTVRQFTNGLKNLKPGTQIVVVNGVTRKIVTTVQVIDSPEQVEQNVKLIFSK